MSIAPFAARCAAILASSHELIAYERWLDEQRRAQRGSRDYLFSEERPRFEPRRDDLVVRAAGLQVRDGRRGCRLVGDSPQVDIPIADVSRRDAERVLRAIDGERCLLEVLWESGVDSGVLARFLKATFGLVVLAPAAVHALENRVSGVEITRFPCAPYGIERPYWENMAAVREHYDAVRHEARDAAQTLRMLRSLHVIAVMGRSLSSFYRPASPVSDRIVAPGALFTDAVRLRDTASGTLFFDGPRVNVSFVGGEGYHRALYESVGEPEALATERSFERDGVDWGRVVRARAEPDDRVGAWFIPPRPIVQAHVDVLHDAMFEASKASGEGDREGTVRALARLHWAFVRLHPFHCANQSLVMSVINVHLAEAVGVGMPHLILDHLALRLSERGYGEAFGRAVRAFCVAEDDPMRRLATLLERKRRSYATIEKLSSLGTATERGEAIAADPSAAQWALVT